MAGEVDGERRLAGAAVAVQHDVPAFGDERAFGRAEQRVGALLVDRDELVQSDDAKRGARALILPAGARDGPCLLHDGAEAIVVTVDGDVERAEVLVVPKADY